MHQPEKFRINFEMREEERFNKSYELVKIFKSMEGIYTSKRRGHKGLNMNVHPVEA